MIKFLFYMALLCLYSFPAVANNADTLLRRGIIENKPDIVSTAIARGAELNFPDENNQTPLMAACQRNCRKQILQSLINAGADINAITPDGSGPIFACLKTTPKISNLKLLCAYGPELNRRNAAGHTPLTFALKKGFSSEIIKLLLDSGAHSNYPAYLGGQKVYPLTLTVTLNRPGEIIEILLSRADTDTLFQALTVVTVTDNTEIRRLFEQHGLLSPAKK